VIPQFVLTVRTLALTLVAGAGLLIIVLRFLAFEPGDDRRPGGRDTPDEQRVPLAGRGRRRRGDRPVRGLVPARDADPHAQQHPGRADRARHRRAARLPRPPDLRLARRAAVGRRLRRRGRRLVRGPVPQHQRAAPPKRGRGRPTRGSCRPTCTRSSSR
jgi:hypothetical protein